MEQLLAIAARQFGLFTRAQALRCGVSDRMLRHRVATGVFERLARGVHRVCGTERSWHQDVLGACLSGGEHCVASHRTAAALHEFDGGRQDVVEVTVLRSFRYKTSCAVVHQSLDLAATDCTFVGPIPVTTPARTLIDLGAVARWERVEEAFDGGERDELTTTAVVARRHAQVRRQGRRGVGPMARVLDGRLECPPKWVIERRFLRLLQKASLPMPECQYRVELPNGRPAFIDAAHVAPKVGWELDGHGAHATRRQRALDNARAAALEDLGWQIRRFTWEQLTREGPAVVRAVRSALASRSCGL